MSIRKISILILFAVLVLAACSAPAAETPTSAATPLVPAATSTANPAGTAYPIVVQNTPSAEQGYPIGTPTSIYPPEMRGPDFSINEPVKAGDTKVTGTGPSDVPIILVNVSFAGEVMASTTISKDGTFEFLLDKPLEAQTIIGLQLGDLTGTNFNANEFVYNENYTELPMVGILFDKVITAP